ncbi:MAG: protease modulator HflC [Alphaproteobacteria bacterium]|nr:MAG: protease modulator HflC [Alphaproteobacteria bacterium]
MQNQRLISVAIAVFLLIICVSQSVFTVHETRKAIVFQFGELKHIYNEPGLKFKLPFIQDVVYYDRRLQNYAMPTLEVTAGDQKRIVVDLYARYLIDNVRLFYKTIGSDDRQAIEQRLSAVVESSMRIVLGQYPLGALLSTQRTQVMNQIHDSVRKSLQELGVVVHDVRIVKADLPKENSNAVYRRMESDRIRIAKRIRAEGGEKAQFIKAQAERDRVIILAEARKKADIFNGEGLAKASAIYATAFKEDPQFFDFYRSMSAYEKALSGENTTMVMSPNHPFFKQFNGSER